MSTELLPSVCPHDCPSVCALEVERLDDGRLGKVRGSQRNPYTAGVVCAKVARYAERFNHPDRLAQPLRRIGAKGSGAFAPVAWDDALDVIVSKMQAARDGAGADTILPLCYGGSNGFLTQDYADAILFRRLGTSRLLRTVCAAPTGAANMGLYGKMASVAYEDYPLARLIVLWGVNPATSGIHLVPRADSPLRNGGALLSSWMPSSFDAQGEPRQQEGRLDIGAYEYQPPLFANGFE